MSGIVPRLFRTEEAEEDDEVECVSPPPTCAKAVEIVVVED